MPTGTPSRTDNPPAWDHRWAVGLRVWVERAGRAVLGPGRLELLEGIERWHSISAAARHMGMSYRRAWLLVQSINEAAGTPLVVSTTGGVRGGGAGLTPQGLSAVAVFRELQEQLVQTAAVLLPRLAQPQGSPAVHVAAAVSLEEVLGQLLADFALRQPTIRVRAVFGGSDELADHLLAGSPADLFLTADPEQLDRLEEWGLLRPHTRVRLTENSLAAIGPAGREMRVRKPADLARPEVTRIAFAEPGCPLGQYTRAYLDGLGLYEKLLPRVVRVDNSRAVVAAVRAGRANAGLVYGSDAARAEGCRLLFRVPAGPTAIRYEAAVLGRGKRPEEAQALLSFLTSATAAPRFRRCGFLPIRFPDR
ncbi:MAG TPA: molybdate ABC transporter substrate-binding protein [Gemmataceae bacterium]|nr:molybdate ABC transporter substrate-binding protein [Gemmataceae bacterium]